MNRLRRCVLALCALLVCAQAASAQSDTTGYSSPTPRWVGQFTTLSANAAIGGLTAGIVQKLRGGSFKDGFTRGAFGGSVIYGGKWLVGQRFYGAGMLGRTMGGVGASMVRNASDGVGTLDRLMLPAGFTRIYWDRRNSDVRVKLDVVAAGYVVYGFAEHELHFDASESLSSGTFVFKTDNRIITVGHEANHAGGVTAASIIFQSHVPGWGEDFLQRTRAHERVHMVQDDQLFITLNDRLDDYAFRKTSLQNVSRYIDVNIVTEVLKLLGQIIPEHDNRPWEIEAIYLSR